MPDNPATSKTYKPTKQPPRLSVFLTNSLEEGEPANQTLPFTQWLSREAKGANTIKRDMPIMCLIGNPPYNIQSGNMADDQIALVKPYRSVDGVLIKEKGMLQFEKNINNDYIKFLALAENMIAKNGHGILGYITSHGYLKSSSFRGLRAHLMQTFDEIRILDLHGNSEVREVVPAGIADKNVFDIKQGVAVIIAFRKAGHKKEHLGRVQYGELWGSRKSKYQTLAGADLDDLVWIDCKPRAPNYTFHPSGASAGEYQDSYIPLNTLMPTYSSGIITARDQFSIDHDANALVERAKTFSTRTDLSDTELCQLLGLAEKKGWDITKARRRLAKIENLDEIIYPISYRPFDTRKVIYDESVVWTTARSTMDHMLRGKNIALVSARSEKSGTCSHFFLSSSLVETKFGERTTQSAVFPLYLYPGPDDLENKRRSNFDPKALKQFMAIAQDDEHGKPSELDVFDYVYGILYSPNYRKKYAEYLKIDFPRIPMPKSSESFWSVAAKGAELRKLHLMQPAFVGSTPFPFMGHGDNAIRKPKYVKAQVWVNDSQYFDDVPSSAWELFIGGYQPAQKWLKDRKGKILNFEDVKHYQRMLKILSETHRIMKSIAW